MKISSEMPCYNACVRKGTEELDQPQLMSAKHGNFCDNEYHAALKALSLAPGLVEHVLSLVDAKGSPAERVDSSRQALLPMNEQAFNDANNIYQRLVYWARYFGQLLGVQAPGPAVRAWRDMAGNIVGLPVGITAGGARYVVGIMTLWLEIHLDDILALPQVDDVDYFLTGAGQLRDVFAVNARWPRKARAEYSAMPCPVHSCGGKLAVFAPDAAGRDPLIKCERFGHILTQAEYTLTWARYKTMMNENNPTKRHLLRKYGGNETLIERYVDGIRIAPRIVSG